MIERTLISQKKREEEKKRRKKEKVFPLSHFFCISILLYLLL
jgi:hypothetical protein